MNKVFIDESSGQWFDLDKAIAYTDKKANQGDIRQYLYVTRNGQFVINTWTGLPGNESHYKIISLQEAELWFFKHSYLNEELPLILQKFNYDLNNEI